MRPLKIIFSTLTLLSAILFSSCYKEDHFKHARIKSFLWEGILYHANYNHDGLLIKLDAVEQDIDFFYNEDDKLYKAEITLTGAGTPESFYEYIQGPDGITKISFFSDGIHERLTDFTYGSDGELINIINIFEVPINPDKKHDMSITYVNGNVPSILNKIAETLSVKYEADDFDDHKNPFRMLAESVGNPAFFPVGSFVPFQIPGIPNKIQYISWLSKNNPTYIRYYFTEVSEDQPLTYTYYPHGLVKEIVWEYLLGDKVVESYVFQFEYEYR